jgi:hypothetical protein
VLLTAQALAVGWVYYDALDNAEYPLVWAVLVFMLPPLFLPLYIILRLYTMRRAGKRTIERMEQDRLGAMDYRFGSDVERARFIEAQERGTGTLYQPRGGIPEHSAGFAHFTVERAEQLIAAQRFDEAWEYLSDMYAVAAKEDDVRAMDTYQHYICRLPGGAARLSALDPRLSALAKLAQRTDRDVPF